MKNKFYRVELVTEDGRHKSTYCEEMNEDFEDFFYSITDGYGLGEGEKVGFHVDVYVYGVAFLFPNFGEEVLIRWWNRYEGTKVFCNE